MKNLGNVFILGDSYSTFKGYIPDGYAIYYDTEDSREIGINNVGQTWWKQVIDATSSNLLRNCSWSGTTVCHTGYSGDCSAISFIARLEKLIENGWFEENKVDTFFLFGGTNDNWANSPLGELMFEDWKKEDLFSVLPAICYIINRVRSYLPNARLIVLLNTELKEEINNGFEVACEKYGAELIKLKDISKHNGHPDAHGMKQICDQILTYIENN